MKRGNWYRVDPSDHFNLPRIPVVYAIFSKKKLVYIGSTQNLRHRFNNLIRLGYTADHYHTPWGTLEKVRMRYSPSKKYGDWLMRELRLIRRLRPRFNRLGVKRAQ